MYSTHNSQVGILVVFGIVLLIGVVLFLRADPYPSPIEIAVPEEKGEEEFVDGSKDEQILIHVAGAVRRPGVYLLSKEGRVVDALELAGGPLPTADLDRINLAAPLRDGQKLEVPQVGPEGDVQENKDRETDHSSAQVNINEAGSDELQALPGVGPVIAERIVSHRNEQGYFDSAEDLLEVPGIGTRTLASFEENITVY